MKDLVLLNNLTTISDSLIDLNNDFNLLLARYKKLKERFYELKNEVEISRIHHHLNYQSNEQ